MLLMFNFSIFLAMTLGVTYYLHSTDVNRISECFTEVIFVFVVEWWWFRMLHCLLILWKRFYYIYMTWC